MDNNSFEQQFKQNVKNTAMSPMATTTTGDTNKLPLIIAIVLAIVTLIESIALIIALSNRPSVQTETSENDDYQTPIAHDDYIRSAYVYDDDYNLIAVNFSCVADDRSSYILTASNYFEQRDSAGSVTASGDYSISNDSLVSLKDSGKVLYYDGFNIADGLTIYKCEEVATESNIDNADTNTE